MSKVSVFGGGAWGRALAFALAEKNEVRIISRRDISSLLEPLNQKLKTLNCTSITEFQDSQGYTEKPCLETNKQTKKQKEFMM